MPQAGYSVNHVTFAQDDCRPDANADQIMFAGRGGGANLTDMRFIRLKIKSLVVEDGAVLQEIHGQMQQLAAQGGFASPESQSPWQQYFREMVQPFSEGMVLRDAPDYKSIARTKGVPRDNH